MLRPISKHHGEQMRKITIIPGLLLTLCSATILRQDAFGQSAAAAALRIPHAAAREFADKQAKEWLARGIPGLAIAVAIDGKLVYSEAFGYADLEERVPAWPTTKFRIGSISKPLTAIALMQLVEAGKIDLDAGAEIRSVVSG